MSESVAIITIILGASIFPGLLAILVSVFLKDGKRHRKSIVLAVFLAGYVVQWGGLQFLYYHPSLRYDEDKISGAEAEQIVEICRERHADERWSPFVSVGYSISHSGDSDVYLVRHMVFPNDLVSSMERNDIVWASEIMPG